MKKLLCIVAIAQMVQCGLNAMEFDGYQKINYAQHQATPHLPFINEQVIIRADWQGCSDSPSIKRNRSASLDCFSLEFEPASKEARYGYLQISKLDLLLNVLQKYPNAHELKDFFVAAQGIKVYSEMLRKSEHAIEQVRAVQANHRLVKRSILADWEAFDAEKESLMHQRQMAVEIKAGLQYHTDMYTHLAERIFGSAIPNWRHIIEIKNKMPNNPYLAVFVKKLQDAGLLV